MSHRQEERFGRVTGHTLRRNPRVNRYISQFVIQKSGRWMGSLSYDDMAGQFEELLSDGNLQESGECTSNFRLERIC